MNNLQVKVYFEYGSCSDLIATFMNEELYIAALPALEKQAKEVRATISESLN